MTSLSGKRVAFMVANEGGIEQVELEQPWDAIRSAGAESDDLRAFSAKLVEEVAEGRHAGQAEAVRA